MLGLNATLVMQIFHFLLLLLLLWLVAYKPLMRILEDRQNLIAKSIEQAEKQEEEARKLKEEMEASLRRSREEAQLIIERATKASEEQAQAILDAAKEEANRMKESALAEIEREKERALAELKDEVANLAILVAGKVIREALPEDLQQKLIQEAISEVKQLPC